MNSDDRPTKLRNPNFDPGRRQRRMRQDSEGPTPWKWLLTGLLVTAVALWGAFWMVSAALTREPLQIAGEPALATIIVVTAAPTGVPSVTPVLPTPTSIPTLTPLPTPDRKQAPPEVTVDYYVQVANTDGIGVSVRGGPSTSNVRVDLASEGAYLLVIDGPQENDGFRWWQVELGDGTQGWVVEQYIEPAAEP